MKFSEFSEKFFGTKLYPHQQMMLDDELDLSGHSAIIRNRNYFRRMWMKFHIVKALRKGESVSVMCATEEAAKAAFDDFVEFFKGMSRYND